MQISHVRRETLKMYIWLQKEEKETQRQLNFGYRQDDADQKQVLRLLGLAVVAMSNLFDQSLCKTNAKARCECQKSKNTILDTLDAGKTPKSI